MPAAPQSIIDTRRHQMFPVLEATDIERVRRFGKVRAYRAGEALVQVGHVGPGLTIILTGRVDVTQHDESGRRRHIVTHGPGSFMGELAQLAGRPALVDAHAQEEVEALIIAPGELRALLIAEAELGEHVMRALILRRVGLLETGAGGPVIVGRPQNADVLRLEGFLRRNGHPYQRLDAETDAEAKALIERFHVDTGQLPIVVPAGSCCAIRPNPSSPAASACWGRSIRTVSMTLSSSARAPPASPAPSTPARKDCRFSFSTAAHSAGRPGLPRVSRTIWAFRRESAALR